MSLVSSSIIVQEYIFAFIPSGYIFPIFSVVTEDLFPLPCSLQVYGTVFPIPDSFMIPLVYFITGT
jgi:hypothetical protein